LHAAWRATGDKALLERHLKTAEGCLSWIDDYGDRDGDGFQEYETRSPVGYENMAWKDSGDCVVYPDGSLVKGPKALCELQGYVYDAWARMADVFDALGKPERAKALRAKASALFDRFNEAFWDEELGFYAYALDGEKKKVLTVASNAGHCLWSGIVPQERAQRVVERLHLPSRAGAGQDDGMDFVFRVPRHLADMSQRRLHALVSRRFRVVRSQGRNGSEQRPHPPESVETTMRTLRQVDYFFTPKKPLDEAVEFLTPHQRQSRQTRARRRCFHPREAERR